MDVVREIVDMRKREGYPHPDEEQLELKRMGEEADEWSKLAGLLLDDLAKREKEEKTLEQPQPSAAEDKAEKEDESGVEEERPEKADEAKSEASEKVPEKLPDEMSVIGVDDNIHPKSLRQAIEEVRLTDLEGGNCYTIYVYR